MLINPSAPFTLMEYSCTSSINAFITYTHPQWLPYRWYFQLIYLVYRWVMVVFFFVWLVQSGLYPLNGGVKYFIFLTNWAFMAFNAHLVCSAIVTSVDFFREFVCCRQQYIDLGETRSLVYERDLEAPTGCCGRHYNRISWYHMIQWAFFMTGVELAIAITILYWPLLYNPDRAISGVNFNTHGSQGIIAAIDLLISGVPIRFYHFYFTQTFTAVYAVFTGIYHAAGGTNTFGRPYIYSILNYGDNPGFAIGLVLAVILVFLPIVHVVLHLVYVARYWLLYLIYGKRTSSTDRAVLEEEKSNSPEEGTELKEMNAE